MQQTETLLVTRRFRVERVTRPLADGTPHAREVVRHPGAAVILPVLDDGRIVLVRNFRVSVGQTLIELPAGTLDPGEDALDTARRELTEETGYVAARMELLLEFFASPGILDEKMRLFLASGLQPGQQDLDAGEELEPLALGLPEAMRMIAAGEIRDAKTIAGLLYYERFVLGR